MVEETEKPEQQAIPPTEAEEPNSDVTEESEALSAAKRQAAKTDAHEAKKGRLIVAGIVATVIVSFLALAVAGVVQLTSRWMVVCPTDLPVNEPAPILWKAAVSRDVAAQPLGGPEKILEQAQFKQKPKE